MFSIISGMMSSKQEVANKTEKTNTIHAFGGNRIVSENANSINHEFSKPVVQQFKPEKTNTIRCFGLNRIVEETPDNLQSKLSEPVVKEYTSQSETLVRKRNVNSGTTPPIFAFGCNYIVNSNPNSSQIKTSMFGFPFVK